MEHIFPSVLLLSGSFILHAIGLGVSQSFGIIYSELVNFFNASKSETSWIASLNSGLLLACGSVGGILVKHYGCRKVAVLGSVIATVGMGTSMFVPSMYFLYLTYGLITGIGMGHFHMASEVAVAVEFDKHRSLAMAIASMGGGIGTFVLPFLTTFCLETYGWRGTFLILAGVVLHGIAASALLKTTHISKEEKDSNTEKSVFAIVKEICSNARFVMVLLSGILVALAYFVPYVMFPDYSKNKGLSLEESSMVITVSGIAGIIGRLVIGFLADMKHVNRFVINGVALLLGGACTIGVMFVNPEYSLYLLYGCVLGIFTGVFAFLQPILVVDLIGKEHLSIAFGLLLFVQGFSVLVGPPIAGWISDFTGRYDEAFIYAGGLCSVAGVISILIPFMSSCDTKKKYDVNQNG